MNELKARPLMRLICPHCQGEMPCAVARGLFIGDGFVTVQDGFSQVCAGCGHEYHAGATLRYYIGTEQEV